ncbi:MAG TPA: phosphotransferase, partial [Burkholderiaceae bacterium]|nr:phosphotransferase [Burkholderiaceae bacterium]
GLDLQPRLLGSEAVAADESYLYLEFIRRAGAWPWRDPQQAIRVVQALARLHGAQSAPPQELSPQREDELHQSALATLHTVEGVAARCDWLRPHLRHLRRIVDALPDVRCELLERESVLIHGDVHSGNVQLVRRAGHDRVVLVDWARARIGHGLEDVSSWLLSLGFWVPGARQRHDTLLAAYVAARGGAPGLTPALRRLYWLAGACNALGGALRYHAWIADPLTASSPRRRADAARAAADWLRVIRRAEAYWQGHGRPRGWSTNCD